MGHAKVYPRGCGAALFTAQLLECIEGLSPRVRGSPSLTVTPPLRPGSIPAGAGQPGLSFRSLPWLPVYPRGCGAAFSPRPCACRDCGLSPRVRGSRTGTNASSRDARSIPAGAGQPVVQIIPAVVCQVYPRGCGAAVLSNEGSQVAPGLSPRVRGSLKLDVTCPDRSGSIPAGAGQPPFSRAISAIRTVYPRGCGAAHREGNLRRYLGGLSPRVRGSQRHNAWCDFLSRSIPAGAGSPNTTVSMPPPMRSIPAGAGQP